ncbi:MAG: hypothetical protein ACPHIB_00955 [Thalassobaculaceae bacterium]
MANFRANWLEPPKILGSGYLGEWLHKEKTYKKLIIEGITTKKGAFFAYR